MNLHLYKVVDMGNCDMDNGEDVLDATRVMTEKDLRKEFEWALKHKYIPEQLIKDYKQDPNYSSEDWKQPETSLKIGTIVDIMNDICNYQSGIGYYILETDIDVELNRDMVDRWLDVLNYWADHIQDLGERYDDMHHMYIKYERVITELYRLTKGE